MTDAPQPDAPQPDAPVSHDLPSLARVLQASAAGLREIVLPATPAGPAAAMTMIVTEVLGDMAHRENAGAGAAAALADSWGAAWQGERGQTLARQAVGLEAAIRSRAALDIPAVLRAELGYLDALTPPSTAAEADAPPVGDPGSPAAIEAYLRRGRRGADIGVTRVFQPVGGFSKSLVIAELTGADRPADGIVIAIDGIGGPIESSVEIEFPMQQALFAAGIPLPEPLWLETDCGVFGAPFSIVRQVPGRTAANAHGVDAAAAPRMAKALAGILAQIHALPIDRLPGGAGASASGPRGQILRSLATLEEQWLRRRIWPSPTLAAAFAWLADNIPENAPLGLVHGDASPRNLMLDDDGGAHIIDWELAHFGDPIEDLIYGRPELASVGQWDNFLAEYEARGGAPFDEARAAYWGLWLDLRNAVLSGAGIHGFETGQQSDIRMVYAGTIYTRRFIQKVGTALLQLSGAAG